MKRVLIKLDQNSTFIILVKDYNIEVPVITYGLA